MQRTQTLRGLFTVRKLILASLFLVVLVDSLVTTKSSVPGHGATFLLAWVLMTRVWLKNPSNLLLLICIAVSIACIASNHGFASLSIVPQSFYFYVAISMVILFWDKLTDFAKSS